MKLGKYITIGQETKPEAPVKEKGLPNLGAAFLDLSQAPLTGRTTVSQKLLAANEGWVYANVAVLAEEVSKVEFRLYTTTYVKGELEFQEIDTHPVLDLLDRFNPFTTTSEGVYMTEAHLELVGDAFYLLDKYIPTTLFLLQPDRVEIIPGDNETNYRIKAYKYKYQTAIGDQKEIIYPPELVIQFKNPNPSNPYRGKSVVEAAAKSIDLDVLLEEFLKKFFLNNATPGMVLSSDQRITKDDITRIEADLRRNYQGVKNAFKSLILGGGLKPTPLQSALKDMMILELETVMRDKIMAMFKNTKSSLGITEGVNRANAETSFLAWKQTVIKPKMQRICDTLNEFLVPRYGENLILGYEDPVPEDNSDEITDMVSLVGASIITVNEAREVLEMSPIDGGDETNAARSERQQNEAAAQVSQQQQQATGKFMKKLKLMRSGLPRALANIDLNKALRQRGIHEQAVIQKNLYGEARKMAESVIKSRRKNEKRKYRHLSNDEATRYWAKQIKLTELAEKRFKDRLDKFLVQLQDKALKNLHASVPKKFKRKDFQLFNTDEEIQAGIDLLTPLQEEIALLSAMEAHLILNLGTLYNPSKSLHDTIVQSVKDFTTSFVSTDQDELTQILTEGIDQGQSIPDIESAIRAKFGQYRKMQSERIARTEILRASNAGQLDAYQQSGVVQAKQWYTAQDGRVDEECAALDGKIVSLSADFFETDYGSGEMPPLHPNCRCVVLPVVDRA